VAGGALQAPVNSSHHQAVARLARDFRTSGMSPDGVIEAFERADPRGRPFLLAVQWHPEAMQAGLLLGDGPLDAFLTSARLH
jgi:putative glutamine amidotransferase